LFFFLSLWESLLLSLLSDDGQSSLLLYLLPDVHVMINDNIIPMAVPTAVYVN